MKKFVSWVKNDPDELLILLAWVILLVPSYQDSKESLVWYEFALMAILSYFLTRFMWKKIFRPTLNFTERMSDKLYRKLTGDTKPRY